MVGDKIYTVPIYIYTLYIGLVFMGDYSQRKAGKGCVFVVNGQWCKKFEVSGVLNIVIYLQMVYLIIYREKDACWFRNSHVSKDEF